MLSHVNLGFVRNTCGFGISWVALTASSTYPVITALVVRLNMQNGGERESTKENTSSSNVFGRDPYIFVCFGTHVPRTRFTTKLNLDEGL